MKFIAAPLAATTAGLAFVGTATAANEIAPPDGSLLDLAKPVFDAVMSGQWALGAALALVMLVALARKYLAPKWAFLGTELGVALMVLVGSFGGALAMALMAGASVSGAVLWAAVGIAVSAAGGWKLAKIALNQFEPWVLRQIDRLPSAGQTIARAIWSMLTWWLHKPGDAEIAKAEAAGKIAVEESPSAGIAGVLGEPKERS